MNSSRICSVIVTVGLPREQKIGVRKLRFGKVKLERSADKFGREFWA